MSNGMTIVYGDCREILPGFHAESIDCCVTSPPYWNLRDYGHAGQIGCEVDPQDYVDKLVGVFREVRRVLKDDGTLWLNLGDSYNAYNGGSRASQSKISQAQDGKRPKVPAGFGLQTKSLKNKDLVGIPWRVALALQADGWFLRQDIIWHKPNPMPESVRDRCTRAHEYLFLLSKSPRYYFDRSAIQEPAAYAGKPRGGSTKRYEQNKAGMDNRVYDTRNRRSVWTVPIKQTKNTKHFATFPQQLIEPCVLCGCRPGGIVLDPFAGSGTTAIVAGKHGRQFIGIEIVKDYCDLAQQFIEEQS